jgi:hypothetical protein
VRFGNARYGQVHSGGVSEGGEEAVVGVEDPECTWPYRAFPNLTAHNSNSASAPPLAARLQGLAAAVAARCNNPLPPDLGPEM